MVPRLPYSQALAGAAPDAYKEINIEEVPGAAEEVIQRTGKRAIPQFVLDGKWIQPYVPGLGFLYQEMAELFGVGKARPDLPADPPICKM